MTDKKPALGAGNVKITLGAPDDLEDYMLMPLPIVAKTISATYGGLRPCIGKVQDLDMNAMLHLVTIGTDAKGKRAREIEDRFWLTPITDLTSALTTYLLRFANGGRPPSESDEKQPEDDESEGNE